MAIWTRSVLVVGVTLLAAACGSVSAGSGGGSKPTPLAGPAIAVTPATALFGGQPLRVRITGFPPNTTIELYECAAPGNCDTGAAGYTETGSAGGASTTFIAQPAVQSGSTGMRTQCNRQCDLIAVAVKQAVDATANAAPTASARLLFATTSGSTATNLAYASLLGTSWISATEGWALAAQPCAKGTCTRFARTTDAGRTWHVLPDPPARIQDATVDCSVQACVSQVSFVSPDIGYLYGPALLMTTDGGLTWHAESGAQTETLAIARGQVYRVSYGHGGCPGPCQPSLQAAPAGSTSWRTVIGQLAEPDRSDSAQIAVSGSDVLVAMYGSLAGPVPAQAVVYRSVDGGGTWRQAADPCTGLGHGGPTQEEDLIGVTAAAGGFFAGLCAPHQMTSTFVITSADPGATWRPTAAAPPGQFLGIVAAASPTTIAVASGALGGGGSNTAQLFMTTDGGRRWVTAVNDTQNLTNGSAPAGLEFETPLAGQWLGDPHGVWTTSDGGLHWTRTPFR